MDIAQSCFLGLFFQFDLNRTGTHNHNGVARTLCGLQQNMQALVVAKYTDKQKKLGAKLLAPKGKLFSSGHWISCFV